MRVVPAVDVLDGRVVRLHRGDFETATIYGDDPPTVARQWMSQGADLVHVVDLDGARSGVFHQELWASMTAAGVSFQAGGGLRSSEVAARVLEIGATRAVLGSLAVWHPDEMADLVKVMGADRVVAAVDVKEERAVGSGWEDDGRPVFEVLDSLLEAGVPRALLTSVARDGLLEGPDLDLLGRVTARYPELRLIASGGVSSLDDLSELARLGVDEAVVGRALYEGSFTLSSFLRRNTGDY